MSVQDIAALRAALAECLPTMADGSDAATYATVRCDYLRAVLDALESAQQDAAQWHALYRRAVNEANGLTNYVDDRPELRRAERNLTAIAADARAAMSAKEPT